MSDQHRRYMELRVVTKHGHVYYVSTDSHQFGCESILLTQHFPDSYQGDEITFRSGTSYTGEKRETRHKPPKGTPLYIEAPMFCKRICTGF